LFQKRQGNWREQSHDTQAQKASRDSPKLSPRNIIEQVKRSNDIPKAECEREPTKWARPETLERVNQARGQHQQTNERDAKWQSAQRPPTPVSCFRSAVGAS